LVSFFALKVKVQRSGIPILNRRDIRTICGGRRCARWRHWERTPA